MIDRENKKIINGFGTIGVYSKTLGKQLILKHIDPPKEIGSNILGSEYIVKDVVKIDLSIGDWHEFLQDLKKVNAENNKVHLKGWEINFERFNQKSVDTYIEACTNVLLPLLAC